MAQNSSRPTAAAVLGRLVGTNVVMTEPEKVQFIELWDHNKMGPLLWGAF